MLNTPPLTASKQFLNSLSEEFIMPRLSIKKALPCELMLYWVAEIKYSYTYSWLQSNWLFVNSTFVCDELFVDQDYKTLPCFDLTPLI